MPLHVLIRINIVILLVDIIGTPSQYDGNLRQLSASLGATD